MDWPFDRNFRHPDAPPVERRIEIFQVNALGSDAIAENLEIDLLVRMLRCFHPVHS